MQEKANQFLTTPLAILLGSFVIAIAILIQGGVIKLGRPATGGTTTTTQAAQPAPAAPAGGGAAKTEADIVKNLKDQAKSLGLNQEKFNKCLDSGEKAKLVQTDLDDGSKVGVGGTPTFFINGRMIPGAAPFDQFKTIFEEELSGKSASPTPDRKTVASGDLPPLGQTSAKVTMVEFSDYQCPFCSRHFTQAEPQIKKDYVDTGKLVFYYRDFPLSSIHPGAQKAAEAARCAGNQNKYWEYHDLVFTNQQNIF